MKLQIFWKAQWRFLVAQTGACIKPDAVTCTATSGSAGKTLVKFVNGDTNTRWAEPNHFSDIKPSE